MDKKKYHPYSRNFITLKQERHGFNSSTKEPSGRCIIEIKDGKGKLSTYAQGLKQLQNGEMYRVYLIAPKEAVSWGVPCGWLNIDQKGKGEVSLEFDPSDMSGSGIDIEDFKIVCVLVKKEGSQTEIVAPLVGYKDIPCIWKNNFKEYNSNEPTEISSKEDKQPASVVKLTTTPNPSYYDKILGNNNYGNPTYTPEMPLETEEPIEFPEIPEPTEMPEPLDIPETSEPTLELYEMDTKNELFASENDFYGDLSPSITKHDKPAHENFLEAVHQINSKVDLSYYEMVTYDPLTYSNSDKHHTNDLDHIMKNNTTLTPFANQNRDVKWVRITVDEIVTLPIDCWKYMNHPFIISASKKYNHLILGKFADNGKVKYVLGVPGEYNQAYKLHASKLGFKQFKPCENKNNPTATDYGYWLMII